MDARLRTTLLLGALLLAPLASADHVFSHRVYVVGRVIDAEGLPAPGLAVNVTFEGAPASRACFDSKAEVTGPTGDYEVCRHVHAIADDATVTVRVGGAQKSASVDPDLRHAVASLQLDGPAPFDDINGERTFARTFLVTGRMFELLREPQEEEGIEVDARPFHEEVNVSIRAGEEVLANATAKPDEHGRYRAQLEVGELPPGAVVRVVAGRDGGEEVASALMRRADLNVVRDSRLVHGPGDDAPGTGTPFGAWLAVVALGAAAVAGRTLRSDRKR